MDGPELTQRYDEARPPDVGVLIPKAEQFARAEAKVRAEAQRRELARQSEEARRNQNRRRIRVRLVDRDDAIYIISIAARLADMHPQTLRKYDREGLVSPSRTEGSRRLYSDEDLERLQIVRRLSDDLGLNLSGVALVLELVKHLREMVTVLENSEDVAGSVSALAVAEEIKVMLNYLGVE